jgi:hypothetical protein
MTNWIIVAFLYVLGMGSFHLLGGIRAAGEALRSWGHASTAVKTRATSASS